MRNVFKKIVTLMLAGAAKLLLFRKKPEIIGITGSAGKTSTKEFLKELLEIDFEVLASSDGYNTEIGAPLMLFGEKAPEKTFSPVSWFLILLRVWWKALFLKEFPEKVIIEMGADKPGDIKYLTKIFPPKTAIVLSVLPTHLLEFKTIEGVAVEKSELVCAVPKDGKVFLNADDKLVKEMALKSKGAVVYFGTNGEGYSANNLKSDIAGLSFDVNLNGKNEHFLANLYGEQTIYPLMAALAVSREEHINVGKLKEKIRELKPFKGRMNVIEGIKGSLIIDDSYNANPGSTIRALEFLKAQKGRKIALLGNMNELGDFEEEGHRKVGAKVAESANMLVTVGEVAQKYLADEAKKNGISQIESFDKSTEAGEWLKKNIKEGDIILAKGSQNKVRIEKAIELIMAHPEQKENILVRQGKEWQERP